tara:strand:- start:184 stop:405 length:222 start_codon:yes stop_codon:yes gene_type:complete
MSAEKSARKKVSAEDALAGVVTGLLTLPLTQHIVVKYAGRKALSKLVIPVFLVAVGAGVAVARAGFFTPKDEK